MPVTWVPLRRAPEPQGPDGLMPDLRGLSARAAVRTLGRLGAVPRLTGTGFVTNQRPEAGTAIETGVPVDLRLSREMPARRRGHGASMTLSVLFGALVGPGLLSAPPVLSATAASAAVTSVAYDSRRAGPGTVFVALRGQKADGAQFAAQAVARGALAVVAEAAAPAPTDVPWLVVPDARLALAVLADQLSGQPSQSLRVIGITGTNGKTTTGYLLRSIFEAAGMRCGLLGTVVYSLGDQDHEATRTTPEAPDVQRMLRQMLDNGCGAAVMEVSSHALALKRVDAIRFAAAVFSNLTRDHLDFHGDMEAYFAAKRRLFELLPQARRRHQPGRSPRLRPARRRGTQRHLLRTAGG